MSAASKRKVRLVTPISICDSYHVPDTPLPNSNYSKRRRTLPAVTKQTTAAFLSALSDGDIKTAQLLLDSNISASAADRLGRTALHLATCLPPTQTAIQICHTLLDRLCDVNKGDLFGMSPFCYAVSSQNIAMVRHMLKAAKVDKVDKFGNTSLHHASATGNLYIVTAIGKLTKHINKVNILGFTPLMIASKLGHVEVAKVLTQCGAMSGSIRDVNSCLTADEWARFSLRFNEDDLRDLKSAEIHYKKRSTSSAMSRSKHPDCRTGTEEVYRTTSQTLPISVGKAEDQTQLMIKRVMLLRKLSEFFNNHGKRHHGNHPGSHGNQESPCTDAGDEILKCQVKSISVIDLLDHHLSKLTLGGASKTRPISHKSKKSNITLPKSTLSDSGSEDSILERQAKEIEKVALMRRKRRNKNHAEVEKSQGGKRALEPTIVTLVHGSIAKAPIQTPRNSVNSREQSPVSSSRINHLSMTPEMFSPDGLDPDIMIPDCTTVNSKFVRQTSVRSDTISNHGNHGNHIQRYHRDKTLQQESLLLCEKVRYGKRHRYTTATGRVGENPTFHTRTQFISNLHNVRRKTGITRPKSKTRGDPIRGFGPWVADTERGNMFSKSLIVPEIKIDCT